MLETHASPDVTEKTLRAMQYVSQGVVAECANGTGDVRMARLNNGMLREEEERGGRGREERAGKADYLNRIDKTVLLFSYTCSRAMQSVQACCHSGMKGCGGEDGEER